MLTSDFNFPDAVLETSGKLGDCVAGSGQVVEKSKYSQSSPCDHSRKRPALITTSIVEPRLTCHLIKHCDEKPS